MVPVLVGVQVDRGLTLGLQMTFRDPEIVRPRLLPPKGVELEAFQEVLLGQGRGGEGGLPRFDLAGGGVGAGAGGGRCDDLGDLEVGHVPQLGRVRGGTGRKHRERRTEHKVTKHETKIKKQVGNKKKN